MPVQSPVTLSRFHESPTVVRAHEAVGLEWPPAWLMWAYLALATLLLVNCILAANIDHFPGDVAFTRAVQANSAPVRGLMRFSTSITSPLYSLMTLGVAVGLLYLMRRPRLAVFTIGALGAHAIGGLIKVTVDRGRPDSALVHKVRAAEDFSFPSGHTEWVVCFEGCLVFAVFRMTRNRLIRGIAVVTWLVHLALTSLGRIDQGLHWPSDVVASYLVGTLALLFLIWSYRVSLRFSELTQRRQPAEATR